MNLQDKLLCSAAHLKRKRHPCFRNLCVLALLLFAYMGQAQRIEVLNHKGTKLKLGVEVTTATTAPTNPTPIAGDLWYDTSADENNPVAKTYDGSQWVRIAENAMSLLDADGDTRIQVEETTNDDTIRFDVNGKERMTIASSGTLRVAGIPAVNEVVVIVNSGLETYEAASFDFYNSSNTNGLPASLFNSSFESAGASFHAQRDGSTTADWGIGYSFSEAYQINSIRLRSRTDALGARAGGGEFRLYNNGTLVATSSTYQLSTTNSWGASYSPNVTADEVRYIFPNGDNTSNGDGVLNFSEWEISGQTLATAVSPSMLVEAGNMGIGTTTPSEKLHVNGVTRIDVAGTEVVRIDANGIQGAITDADGDTKIQLEETADEDKLRIDVAGTEVVRIDANGIQGAFTDADGDTKIQLEETADEDKLRIDIAGTEVVRIDANGIQGAITDADGDTKIQLEETADEDKLRIDIAGTEVVRIDANGIQGAFTDADGDTKIQLEETADEDKLRIDVAGTEVVRIDANGIQGAFTDADGDTKIQLEETADEDKLRIDIAGTEVVRIDANGIQGAFTDADGDTKIQLEETADEDKLRFDLGGTERLILENKGHLNIRNLNTVIGKDAGGSFTTGTHNIAMGVNALSSSTSGVNNIAIGYDALLDATTADRNIAIGSNALLHNKRGTNGVAIGHDAQRYANDKEGSAWDNKNVAIGYQALRGSTTAADNTGNWNTAIGNQSMRHNTSGIDNTAIGANTLHSNTTGKNNTALGYAALEANTTGESNIAVGDDAGRSVTTGSNNTFLGKGSGNGIATGAANTIVGANVNGLGAGLSNTVIIADGDGNERIYVNSSGNMGIGTTSPNAKMHIKGSLGNNYLMRLENTHASDGEGLLISGKGTTRATPLLQVNGGADGTTTAMRVNANGSVSIGDGATDPNAVLQVRGSVGGNYMMRLENTHASDGEGLVISGKGGAATPLLHINGGTNGSTMVMRVRADGRVGIGTPTPTEELDVVGDIKASGSITPDFVFQKYFTGSSALKADYQFMPLEAVAEFVATHHHLPGVPSATEVAQTGGILVNRATEINLEKIEELFLHLIELKEENELLKTRLQSVEKKLGMKN